MTAQPKSRNRLRDMYEENLVDSAVDYAQLRQRLSDLNLASARNARAIDALMQRLQLPVRSSLEHGCRA